MSLLCDLKHNANVAWRRVRGHFLNIQAGGYFIQLSLAEWSGRGRTPSEPENVVFGSLQLFTLHIFRCPDTSPHRRAFAVYNLLGFPHQWHSATEPLPGTTQ